MTKAETRQSWEARFAAYRSSGLTVSKWCAANDVSYRQFYYWTRKLKGTVATVPPSTAWVSVNVDKPQGTEATLLIKIGSTAIEVKPGYNSALLADVVRTLQTLC